LSSGDGPDPYPASVRGRRSALLGAAVLSALAWVAWLGWD